MVVFNTAYGDKICCDTVNDLPSLTQQCFRDECDINNIVAKFISNSGRIDMTAYQDYYESNFADVSGAEDLTSAYQRVFSAQEAFDAMPSKIRQRFGNDPVELLQFLGDERNRVEAIDLGLIPKPVEA